MLFSQMVNYAVIIKVTKAYLDINHSCKIRRIFAREIEQVSSEGNDLMTN